MGERVGEKERERESARVGVCLRVSVRERQPTGRQTESRHAQTQHLLSFGLHGGDLLLALGHEGGALGTQTLQLLSCAGDVLCRLVGILRHLLHLPVHVLGRLRSFHLCVRVCVCVRVRWGVV